MKFDEIKLKQLLSDNYDKKLVLPNFQRNFVWDLTKQRTLLASYLLSLPIGNLLILKGASDDFSAKDLCFPDVIDPNDECSYLLDGQQRLSTLKSILFDLYDLSSDWKEIFNKLPYHLNNRWFINLDTEDKEVIDFLGYDKLSFNKEYIYSLEPSQIEDSLINDKILVKNQKAWFHPNFNIYENGRYLNNKEVRIKIIEEAAASKLIPLYEIYTPRKKELGSIHTQIIRRIARDKMHKLQLLCEENKELTVKILSPISPDISNILDNNDEGQLQILWTELQTKWANDVSSYLNDLLEQNLAHILLPREEFHRAFAIFEVINQGGTPLDEYDIIVAKAARNRSLPPLTNRIVDSLKHDISIPTQLSAWVKGDKIKKITTKRLGLIEDNQPTNQLKQYFLHLTSIFSNTIYGDVKSIALDHIKRNTVLKLKEEQINGNLDEVIQAIRRTSAFLQVRCGIIKLSAIPYKLMFLPIAYALIDKNIWKSQSSLDKIEYWYWSSIFSGYYRDNQNSKAKNDIAGLYQWLKGGENIFETRFRNSLKAQKYCDIDTLQHKHLIEEGEKIPSAIHNTILQYVLSKQPVDFIYEKLQLNAWDIGKEIEFEVDLKEQLDLNDHHILPLGQANDIKESSNKLRRNNTHKLNSPLNRTYISSIANKKIGSRNPESYLKYVCDRSAYNHLIPNRPIEFYRKKQEENEDQFYDRILKERFDYLYREIRDELMTLVN